MGRWSLPYLSDASCRFITCRLAAARAQMGIRVPDTHLISAGHSRIQGGASNHATACCTDHQCRGGCCCAERSCDPVKQHSLTPQLKTIPAPMNTDLCRGCPNVDHVLRAVYNYLRIPVDPDKISVSLDAHGPAVTIQLHLIAGALHIHVDPVMAGKGAWQPVATYDGIRRRRWDIGRHRHFALR